ncbi:MAG TPA: hypothetical protein VFS13_13115 [Steroidobacteraceae bacterium]|jgi:uncharacterized repeat protein (TIGR01451 family)|nr:hypothetical protein [Steroidobacteraceae bacterium]
MQSLRIPAFVAAATLALAMGAQRAHAEGVLAGTHIDNTATVDFTVGTVSSTATSNTVRVTVAEVLNVDVTVQTATVPVTPSANGAALRFKVTNTGNGKEAFLLVLNNAIPGGDQFDPVAASPSIYFDTNGDNIFNAGDTPYVAGSNDPDLDPDGSVIVFLVNNIPAAVVDGNSGFSSLTASARTGTGAPGTVFAGQGDGGVDAVVGTSQATQAAQGAYLVEGVTITANKTQAVVDQFGGTSPIPNAVINYTITINAVGTGTALASVFTDKIPAGTTYVAGSLRLNSAVMTDNADADVGFYETSPEPRVRVQLGDLTQTSGTQTVQFAVRINP